MTERFTIDDWLMYDDGEHINTRQAVKIKFIDNLLKENKRLKDEKDIKKGMRLIE